MVKRTSLLISSLIICFVLIVGCVSSTSNSAPAYEAPKGSSSGASSTDHWQAKVEYAGSWQGALGYNNNVKSISGSGATTFEIPTPGYFISINAQKKDNSGQMLTVKILKNGNVVATENTVSEYGVAMTSTSTS
jgi:hypothetical protein